MSVMQMQYVTRFRRRHNSRISIEQHLISCNHIQEVWVGGFCRDQVNRKAECVFHCQPEPTQLNEGLHPVLLSFQIHVTLGSGIPLGVGAKQRNALHAILLGNGADNIL